MAAAIVAAAFEDVGKADQIGIDISKGIDQRIAHAGLRPEMYDIRKAVLGKEPRHPGAVREVELDEAKTLELCELGEPRLFQLGIIVGIQIVEPDHSASLLRQTAGDVITDESGGAGNEDGIVYSRHRSISSGLQRRSSRDLTSTTMPCPRLSSFFTSGQPPAR